MSSNANPRTVGSVTIASGEAESTRIVAPEGVTLGALRIPAWTAGDLTLKVGYTDDETETLIQLLSSADGSVLTFDSVPTGGGHLGLPKIEMFEVRQLVVVSENNQAAARVIPVLGRRIAAGDE